MGIIRNTELIIVEVIDKHCFQLSTAGSHVRGGTLGEPEQAFSIYQTHMVFTQQRIEYWLQNNLFTWQWWLLIALLILPVFLWWKVVDKKRLLSIVTMGLMVTVTSNWMDQVGSELGWWYYPYHVVPFSSQFIPVNYSLMPIGYMLLYQNYPRWPAFIAISAITAAVLTWLFEPLFSWFGMYHLVFWKFSFSFPFYVLIAFSHKWLADKLTLIANKSKLE